MPSSTEEAVASSDVESDGFDDRAYYASSPGRPSRRKRRGSRDSAVVYRPVTERGEQIEIHSKFLVKAIKDVNKHPPLRTITEHFGESEPFPTLFDHMEDIRREIQKLNNEDARRDLQRLEEATEHMAARWKQGREDDCDSGTVSFDTIWTLFRAGDRVVREDSIGNLWVFVLVDVAELQERTTRNTRDVHTKRSIEFTTWLLNWDGFENELSRQSVVFKISSFPGRKAITSLPVYPFQDKGRKYPGGIDKFLAGRGQKWWRLITPRTSCLKYDGPALSHKLEDDNRQKIVVVEKQRNYRRFEWEARQKRSRVEDRMVIDSEAKQMSPVLLLAGGVDDEKSRRSVVEIDNRREYLWDELPTTTKLTDEQASLCPPIIGCYSVKTKEFFTVSVEKLDDVEWDTDAMEGLVLHDRRKSMLKGLVGHHYSPQNQKLKGDIIAGKGHGLVILLHGPPGVGKTLTAECVSEAVQKPLLSLSIGDLVRDELRLEERLEAEFKRATDWDAILLLDEADVVLEARSFEDVRRNAIVSVFLRQLEYYNGVLFLTTNRVSTMDTAFQSRIQIGIGFETMTPATRYKVWLRLLALNGRDTIIGEEALRDVKQKLSRLELNGRQIRNVLNVAEGLAFEQSAKLDYKHIKEAAEATVEFQKYLEESKLSMKTEQTVWAPYRNSDNEFSYA